MKVTFFRSALNSNGDVYKMILMSVVLGVDVDKVQGISNAINAFEEHMGVSHWQEIAEFYEID